MEQMYHGAHGFWQVDVLLITSCKAQNHSSPVTDQDVCDWTSYIQAFIHTWRSMQENTPWSLQAQPLKGWAVLDGPFNGFHQSLLDLCKASNILPSDCIHNGSSQEHALQPRPGNGKDVSGLRRVVLRTVAAAHVSWYKGWLLLCPALSLRIPRHINEVDILPGNWWTSRAMPPKLSNDLWNCRVIDLPNKSRQRRVVWQTVSCVEQAISKQ